MIRVIIFLCIILGTFLHAEHFIITPKEQVWLEKNKTIRVRVAPNLPPFQNYENGKPVGIAVDYIQYVANTLGIHIEFISKYSWEEALARIPARNGVDVLLQAMSTEERNKQMLFSKPYTTFAYALMVNKAVNENTFFSTTPKKIALVKNVIVNEKLQHDFPHFTFILFDNNLDAMKAVNANVVDGYVGNSAMMALFVQKHTLDNVRLSSFIQYRPLEQSIVTGKDWPEFISLFDKVLSTMPPELHVKIKRKHIPFLVEDSNTVYKESKLDLSKEEKAFIDAKKVIKVSNEKEWAPYDFYQNSESRGYAIDLIEALSQKIGLHVEYVTDTWPNLFEKFKRKEIDIAHPVFKTQERAENFLYSTPFITMELSLIAQSKRHDISGMEDMKGKTIGVGKGWASSRYFKDKYHESTFIEYDTTKEMLEAIAFGIIDAGIDDYFSAMYFIKREQLANLRIVTSLASDKQEYKNLYLMFQKDGQILQSLFNRALKSIQEDELGKMRSKWIQESIKKNELFISTQEEQMYLSQKGVIKMCIDPNWMPLEMNSEGKHIGMAADYIKYMEAFIGIPIQMVPSKTWVESLELGKERKCDIFSLVMPTPQRRMYLDFTKPYLSIPLVLVGRLEKSFYTDIGALRNYKIGIAKGYAYGEILKVRYPEIEFVEVESESDGLKKVEEGKLFASVGTLATTAYEIQKEYFGSLKIIGKFDELWELGIGARNDEPLLVQIFDKAISAIEKNESQEILNKWISVNYDKSVDYSLMYKILAGVVFLVLVLFFRHWQLRQYNAQLEVLSSTDKLTGISNRLKLDDILAYEKKIFDRYHTPLSIIMFDLDYFKQINDNYGHKVGDDILKKIAFIISNTKRETDAFGRWGGEEFLVICPKTDLQGALVLAEKFRQVIEQYEFVPIISLTASFGVATFEKYETIEKVFNKADKALYRAKEYGRNNVKA